MGKMSIHLSSPGLVLPQMEVAWLRKTHNPTPAGHNLSLGLLTPRAIGASWWPLPKHIFIGSHYPTLLCFFLKLILSSTFQLFLLNSLYWLPDFCFHKTQKQYSGLPSTLQLMKHESPGSTLSSSLEAWLHLSLCSAPTASSAVLSCHLQTSLKQLFSLYCLSIFSFTDKSHPSEQRYAIVSFICSQ